MVLYKSKMTYKMKCQECGHAWEKQFKATRCTSCCGNDVDYDIVEPTQNTTPTTSPRHDEQDLSQKTSSNELK